MLIVIWLDENSENSVIAFWLDEKCEKSVIVIWLDENGPYEFELFSNSYLCSIPFKSITRKSISAIAEVTDDHS